MRQYRTYVTTCYKPDIPDSIYDVKPLRRPRGKVFFCRGSKTSAVPLAGLAASMKTTLFSSFLA